MPAIAGDYRPRAAVCVRRRFGNQPLSAAHRLALSRKRATAGERVPADHRIDHSARIFGRATWRATMPSCASARWNANDAGMSPTSCTLRRRARLAAGLRKSGDARVDARALEGADDAVVIGWSELTREQEKRLVSKVGEADRARAGERMARAEHSGHRLCAQWLALDAVHPLRMQNETDVDLAGDEPGGGLRAEVLARHHSHIRTVVRDRRQQRWECLEARRRCVAESHSSRQARAGKTRTLDRPLYCREHHARLVEKRTVTRIEPCSRERGLNAYPAPFRLILKAGGRKEFRLLGTGPSAAPG
jgi:hypothetical protein